MPGRVVVHIGTHKTGTTSIQQFLLDQNAELLADVGACHPPGFFLPSLHADLPLLTARPDRMWPSRLRFPGTQRVEWQAAAERHVRHQVTSSPQEVLVYSHEDLSYLRFDDELERLRDLFGSVPVDVVVFLRDRSAFLRSYEDQLLATGFDLSDDPASFAYVRPDSWLVDYDALVDGFQRWFGRERVRAVDYDEVVGRDGSVIPAFAEVLGIERSSLPPLDRYFFNQAGMHLRPTDQQLDEIRRRVESQGRE